MSVLHYPSSRQESVSSSSSLPAITSLSLIRVTERLGRPSKRDWSAIDWRESDRKEKTLQHWTAWSNPRDYRQYYCPVFYLFVVLSFYILYFFKCWYYLSILGEKDFILNLWNLVIYILEYFILDLDSVIIKIIYWYIIDFDKQTGRHWFERCWLFYI